MKPRYKKRRSGFEDKIEADLIKRGINYTYETLKLEYISKCCPNCGHTVTRNTYTPDFIIPRDSGSTLIIEAKGYLDSEGRQKLKLVKRDNPERDIRLLFQRNQRIRKGSDTFYGDWCNKLGFPWAVGTSVPEEWLR